MKALKEDRSMHFALSQDFKGCLNFNPLIIMAEEYVIYQCWINEFR